MKLTPGCRRVVARSVREQSAGVKVADLHAGRSKIHKSAGQQVCHTTEGQHRMGRFINYRFIGALLVVGAIAGAVISQWLPNLGGTGFGIGNSGSPIAPKANPKSDEHPETATSSNPTEPEEYPGAKPLVPDSPDVLHVLIDGWQYSVREKVHGRLEYRPASLDQIVHLAENMKGDEDGIRVRISRRGNSRATAEMALQDRLLTAGLREESIRQEEGFVP